MATTISGTGAQAPLFVRPGDSFTYTLDDGLGTFAGTILLESSEYVDFGYTTEATHTANTSSGAYTNRTDHPRYVRFNCTDYTGDSIDLDVTVGSGSAEGLHFHDNAIADSEEQVKMSFTDAGVSIPGTLSVTGAISMSGDVSVNSLTSTAGVTVGTDLTLSALTASRAVFTNGSKVAVSNAITGTGNVVMSASPTLTGTIGAANQTLSGTLGVTGVTTLSGYQVNGTTINVTAFAGGGQGSATPITTTNTVVATCATSGDSVLLPTPVVGQYCTVVNRGAATCAVYPQSGSTINGQAADQSVNIASGASTTFLATSATAWVSSADYSAGAYWIDGTVVESSKASGTLANLTRYIPLQVSAADYIGFQFRAPITGTASIYLDYYMSVANGGNIELTLSKLNVADAGDPTAALSASAAFTFAPGNDANKHTVSSSTSATMAFSVTAGNFVFVKIARSNGGNDTHTGDMRIFKMSALITP